MQESFSFKRPIENSLYSIYGPYGIELLHRLQFIHLYEHKLKFNFVHTVNPLHSRSLEIESTVHYFLCCHEFVTFCTAHMNELNSTNSKSSTLEPDELVRTILYGDKYFDNDSNLKILTLTTNFIKQTQQFEQDFY